MKKIINILQLCIFIGFQTSQAQVKSDLSIWKEGKTDYVIGGIKVEGTKYIDNDLLIRLTGLAIEQKITLPGDQAIKNAIQNIWANNLVANVELYADKIVDNRIFITISVKENPFLNKYHMVGVSKSVQTELKDIVGLTTGRVLTQAQTTNAEIAIKDYFAKKGFTLCKVKFSKKTLEQPNKIDLIVSIDKGQKVRIDNISLVGNDHVSEIKLRSKLKGVKERMRMSLYPFASNFVYPKNLKDRNTYWKNKGYLSLSKTLEYLDPYLNLNLFTASKFDEKKYKEGKESIINYYNTLGYRDAEILADTVYSNDANNLNVELKVNEGRKYYFGNFDWRGNTKYDDKILNLLLSINKGETYNKDLLNSRLSAGGEGGEDISSLYMDDGYLFFNIQPTEKRIYNDTIDYEIRIVEGPQATIKNITISGNDKTSEHVVRRELRTLPGNKFSRSDIVRSIRELNNLGYFNPENINPVPKSNYQDGTVDINYNVEEKSSDKLELSAGFGGNFGVFGILGVTFNNFSLKNIGNTKNWDPLPMGDGQKLNIRVQSNGKQFNSETFSFTEPWLGGKKPTSLSVSFSRSFWSQSYADTSKTAKTNSITTKNAMIGISKRLKWPDDNFVISYNLAFARYRLDSEINNIFINNFVNGNANNLNFSLGLARYSINNPLYPTSGSNISLNLTFTPPYSLLNNKDYSKMEVAEKYKLIEYQKVKFNAEWYQPLYGKLVMKLAAKYGFTGYYNKDIGFTPFERFQMGGDGLSGLNMNLLSRDVIAHRGYNIYSPSQSSPIFNKYTFELRYPLSLNPSSTIYALSFFEAGNVWSDYKGYNPFKLNRSAGLGVRIFLPMFGLLGVDYGIGFDNQTSTTGIQGLGKFTFMLGFEPQ